MFCGRSSSGRARPCQGRGSEFEPRRPLQKIAPSQQGGVFFAFTGRAEARTGHERSERNMPGACFGARVRVAVRLGRQRASLPAPKRNTIPIGWCFFAFTGPPAMCSPSCRQHKSVVFLRRFCFARKMEQGTLFHYLLYFFFFPTTVVPMAAPPLTSSRAIHKAEPLVSPVWGDLGSSFSFAVTVSAFLISFVPSLSL